MGNGVSQKKSAQIGLFSAIMILISAIVGVGIFFKNKSVFSANDYNPYGVLLSWIITFVIVITTAVSFIEIISADKSNTNSGLAGWTRKMCGHKLGRFVLIQMPLFYYALKLLDTSLFTSESLFNIATETPGTDIVQPAYAIVLVAIGVLALFIIVNVVSIKAGKMVSTAATFLKFLPLVLIGILGITFGIANGAKGGLFDPDYVNPNNGHEVGAFNIAGVFTCLPALLFAFDSFLIIGNTSKSMIKPEKNVPLAVVIAVPVVACVYLLVTMGQLFTGSPDVYSATSVIVEWFGGNKSAIMAFNIVIGTFISISLFGVMNSFALTSIRSLQSAIDENIIIGSHKVKKWTKHHELYGGVIATCVICFIFLSFIGTSMIVLDSDCILDGVSNFPALFFFGLYSIIISFALVNHYTDKVEVRKMKVFPYVAVVAIIGCAFALGYNMFYQYSVHAIMEPMASSSWGMFKKGQFALNGFPLWIAAIVFWCGFLVFIGMPFLNDLLIKKFRKVEDNVRLIWQ